MNIFEIIGRLIVMHNQCENQFSELGKEIDHIINSTIENYESVKIDPGDLILILAKFRMMNNLMKDYEHLLREIILEGSIQFSDSELNNVHEILDSKMDGN